MEIRNSSVPVALRHLAKQVAMFGISERYNYDIHTTADCVHKNRERSRRGWSNLPDHLSALMSLNLLVQREAHSKGDP
jgi:hypothetical protein